MNGSEMYLQKDLACVASLDEPIRRALYEYVIQQDVHVSRDQAAAAVDISRALAAFHLDKLVEEGLLATTYRRLNGKSGPGAGRPSKLYHRSQRQIELTLPPRRYEFVARLLARSVQRSGSAEALAALLEAARDEGIAISKHLASESRNPVVAGQGALRARGQPTRPVNGSTDPLSALLQALRQHGYEPCLTAGGSVRLRNCPFHALTDEFRGIVCDMNLAFLKGVLAGAGMDNLEAMLAPQPNRCCVSLQPTP